MPKHTQDRPKLGPIFRYWQRRLGLENWKIWYRYTSPEQLGNDRCGAIVLTRHIQEASISILDPKEANKADRPNLDVEETVVHELVHIHIDPFFQGETRADVCLEEWAVVALSKALVQEHRASRRKPQH